MDPGPNVRFGSLADLTPPIELVCFVPEADVALPKFSSSRRHRALSRFFAPSGKQASLITRAVLVRSSYLGRRPAWW